MNSQYIVSPERFLFRAIESSIIHGAESRVTPENSRGCSFAVELDRRYPQAVAQISGADVRRNQNQQASPRDARRTRYLLRERYC